MPTNIAAILQAVLDANAREAAAKATAERLRAILVTEANREVSERGVFPTWKAAGSGVARFDAAGEWTASAVDLDAVGSYLAQRHPAGVAATIELMDAAKLPEALDALAFAGIVVQRSEARPRPTFLADWSKGLIVDVVEVLEADDQLVKRVFTVMEVDEQGVSEVVPGMTGTRQPAKLVITLDKAAKRKAIADGLAGIEALIPVDDEEGATPAPSSTTPATPPAATPPAPVQVDDAPVLTDAADPKGDDGDVFDADLDAMKVEPLKRLARSMGLPAGGTKAVLRDRILARRRELDAA